MTLGRRLFVQSAVTAGVCVLAVRALGADASDATLAFAAAIALGVGAAVAFAFSRVVARDMVRLRDATRALAAGDMSARPPLSAPGEVGELANAVHRLAEQLQGRIGALQAEDAFLAALIESLNEGVLAVNGREQVVRINESGLRLLGLREAQIPFSTALLPRDRPLHQAIHAALRGQSTELAETTLGDRQLSLTAHPLGAGGAVIALFDLTEVRRLEQVRRDFVANVSHELRTPLTVMGGFAETLAEEDLPPDRRRHFAQTILAHAQRMQRIVDDLLDLSRIESGGWVPHPVEVDLSGAAHDAATALHRKAEEKGLELNVRIAPDTSRVTADRTALRQILANLVENAIRHTSSGSVTIAGEREDDGVWISVTDTGTGIPAAHLQRIFERFYRVEPGRTRDSGGTGLGLAIVRHFVEAHGGRVRAESEVGRGTTVSAYFPDQPPDQQLQLPGEWQSSP